MVANRFPMNMPRFPKPTASVSDAVRVMEADEEGMSFAGAMVVLALVCVGLKLYVLLGAVSLPHVFQ